MSPEPPHSLESELSPEIVSIARSENRLELNLVIPAGLVYFRGHFTEFPILPGVVQLDWAIKYGSQYFALGRVFASTIRIKFNQPMRPDHRVTLSLEYLRSRDSIQFDYKDADGACSSGRIGFAKA